MSAALSATLAGCGDSGAEAQVATYPVKGKVLQADGRPMTAGQVIFVPDGPAGRRAVGDINSDGTFALMTYKSGDGAAPGNYRVAIDPTPAEPGKPASVVKGKKGAGFSGKLQKYSDEDTSGLVATVKAEDNALEPFTLK